MATPTALRVLESQLVSYRRIWHSHIIGSVVQPLLYLVGMGLGVGALVDRGTDSAVILDGVSYFAFLAPALLATTAMMSGGQGSLWEVLDGFQWGNQYRAMTATPLSPGEVATGVALWHATRVAIGVSGVAIVLLFFDETRSFGLLAALPAAVLTGLAFALPLTAWSASRDDDKSFPAVMRFGLVPMFLFGGAFYPIEQLPGWIQPAAYATPLWHGVQLCRGAVVGGLEAEWVGVHVAVLMLFAGFGWLASRRSFTTKLRP